MKQTSEKAPDDNDDAKKRKKSSKKHEMLFIFREICFLLVVTCTAYAAILNAQPKTKKGAPSAPFFGKSFVDDFYQGDLSQLMHEVESASYSFVFFYAPWDADSQDLKNEFLETAEFYAEQVYFAGVNCWEPGSECRTRFKDVVERYPQLVAYVGLERSIEYRGPHKADHMIKFLHSILHPIIKLDSISELWKVRYIHDAVIVGYLHVHGPYDTGLSTLYEASLFLASRDYVRRTAVAVFTHSKFNNIMGVDKTPSIHLYIWNKKMEYQGPLKRSSLLKWIMENSRGQMVSTNGLLHLKPPTVVMFTPIHPLTLFNPYYLMFRRVAMTAKDNTTSESLEKDFFSFIIKQNTALQSAYYQELVQVENESREYCTRTIHGSQTCSLPAKWNNITCRAYTRRKISVRDENTMLKERWREEECKLLDRTPLLPPSVPAPLTGYPLNTTFGFACLDSNQFTHLADALGINLSSEPNETSIVIIGEEEMAKVPANTEDALWSALKDWTHGKKERAVLDLKNNPLPTPQKGRVYLPDLNIKSFTHLLQQSLQHALILYHSHYCGACARASHSLLELANVLKGVGCLHIARIDGDKVDLPWHFSLHFFPSLLFLPAIKKAESRLFPADAPWTFNSLSMFILANLNFEERPEVMLALCAKWGQYPEKSIEGNKCIREVRKVSLDGIEMKLKEARRKKDRKGLLIHLGFLKAVHLLLARVTNIAESLTAIKSLSKEYNVGCSVT